MYNITNLGLARQFLGIEIHRHHTAMNFDQKVYIDTILRHFSMQHTHCASMPMDPSVKLDLAEDWGEKVLEQDDITDCQAVMGSLMYAVLATRLDISYGVAAFSRYNLRPFTSHMTTSKRDVQYLKSTADFQLHFAGNGIGIDIGIDMGIHVDNSLIEYSDSHWANDSAVCKSQGGHVFLASNGAILWQSRKRSLITCQLWRPGSSPSRRPLAKQNRYFNYRKTFTENTYHHCQSTATIRVLSPSSPRESSKLELITWTFAITTVEICIHNK